MKSLKGQILIKITILCSIIFIVYSFVLPFIVQKKAETQIIQNIEYIRDVKYKSLNKDNLATAFSFSSLDYVMYILDSKGKMLYQNNYTPDKEVLDFCAETDSESSHSYKDGTINKFVAIKKNGELCFVVEGTANSSIVLGQFVGKVLYLSFGILLLLMVLVLVFVYRKIKKPIKQISENSENALFFKWNDIKPVNTKIVEIKDLDKYNNLLIEMLRDRISDTRPERLGEVKEVKEKYMNKQTSFELNKFKLAVDSAPDIILIVDKFGYINYTNTTLTNFIDMAFSDIENKKITDLWHSEDDVNLWKESYAKVLREQKPITFSDFGRKKGGIRFEAEVKISPIKNKDGSIENFLIIERDVSDEKQKERIKTEFISVVSHELRTPMTVIRGYSSLLSEGKLGDLNAKQKEYVDKINSETGRLLELANDMLDLQKFESGKIELHFEKTNMAEFIEKIIGDFKMEYNKKGLTLEKEDNLENKFANIDHKYFERVITNLLTNAFKFTEKGGVKIFLLNPDPKNIVIAVKDTGIGIKDDALPHLFERFYQASGVMNRKQEGSGLGLSIVKTVTTAHSGMAWVESMVGVGTTFYVAIPVSES